MTQSAQKHTEESYSPKGFVPAKELQAAVADLHAMRPGPGLAKVALYGTLLAICFFIAAQQKSNSLFIASCIPLGLIFGFFIILTHDAIHHTLTGWAWFDNLLPRLLSYPFLWCHGCYAEIHMVHHRTNGWDLTDPERVQPTQDEYDAASSFAKWTMRNQFLWNIFICGGIGMMMGLFFESLKRARHSRAVRRALIQDVTGMFFANSIILTAAVTFGFWQKWLIGYVVVERITGAIQQFRSTLEHYDTWGKQAHFLETQVLSSRNVRTNSLVSFVFNGLNFHSVHHAFPKVPFFSLKQAHQRLEALYTKAGGPQLAQTPGYARGFLNYVHQHKLIPNSSSPKVM